MNLVLFCQDSRLRVILLFTNQLIQIKLINMRIMELYRIESDYQNHKKRLENIKKLNPQNKINRITSQYFNVTNEHKKIREVDHSFQMREESSRRQHARSLMNRTIIQHNKKLKQHYEPLKTILPATQRANKSLSKNGQFDKIDFENTKMKFKIDNMKSVYRSIRRNSEMDLNSNNAQKEPTKKSEKDKIMELLKKQFNIEPIVVFPKGKSKNVNQETAFEGIDQAAFKKEILSDLAGQGKVLQ